MSGITPILDTVLHQVLGWQRDAPAARALPDRLIPPPRPAQPAAAMHSDSRLDPRAPRTAARGGGAAERAQGARPTGSYGAAVARADGTGAVTRLSVAARVIGDILARYPEAATVIRAPAPLLDAATRADVATLAEALRASIAISGLFYEAHVRQWSNGTLPLAQLAREPQMAPAVRGDELEAIVRQQLELLAVPVLRWEGDAWPGLFVAMTLMPPWWQAGPGHPRAGDDVRQGPAGAWRSTFVLQLRHLGEVAIDVRLSADRLVIGLGASPAAAECLQAGGGELRHRIRAAGFRYVTVRVGERTNRRRVRGG